MVMQLDNYKIYIHKERGFVYMPVFSNMSYSKVLNLNIDGFRFIPNRENVIDKFGRKISICTTEGKVFAGINHVNGKVFFDTKMGMQKMLDELIASLRRAGYMMNDLKVKQGYVEICARFPWEKVEESHKLLDKIKIAFRTQKTNRIIKGHDSVEYKWLYMIKNVLFGKFVVNMKVYLALKYVNGKCNNDLIAGFDRSRLPKIEVQITNPDNLEVALNETIPIVVAFLKTLGCSGEEMIEEDYERIRFVEKNAKGYQQIFRQLEEKEKKDVVFVNKSKFSDSTKKIISMLYEKPRSIAEIKQELKISGNSARKALRKLENEEITYSRGRSGVPAMHAIKLQGQ